jgi:hypothetical protein
VSVIEKPDAAVSVEVTVAPPDTAVDVTLIVHTVDDVCAMESILEIFERVKSTPSVVLSVEHEIASFPVTVKLIDAEVADEEVTPSVTVGAVVSLAGLPVEDSDAGPLPFAFTARMRMTYDVPEVSEVAEADRVEMTSGESLPDPSARAFHVAPSSVEYSYDEIELPLLAGSVNAIDNWVVLKVLSFALLSIRVMIGDSGTARGRGDDATSVVAVPSPFSFTARIFTL